MGRGQELLDAAREGHCRVVEKLLAQINKRSGPFTSLRRGAGPKCQDDNGIRHYIPLLNFWPQMCTGIFNYIFFLRDIVHTLLEMGASPCTVDKKGATPLHLAAFKGDAEAVGMLLEHHNPPVNVDQLTHDGDSALLIAAQFGFTSVVSQLIARGADVTIKNVTVTARSTWLRIMESTRL
ncbi:unnamed protein product [Arctia plantaginis]|uniref:Ankyrin repeat protein n=1 Tax=Arctia plantaginis TaxID=874455 RepID=A0A8S1AYB3_ARCPL|nr:unnamed protein product [Arctia plantaginis]